MLALALSSLRQRTTAFTASFLAMFLGATILMSFASLLDTRREVAEAATRESLLLLAMVVGGWGLVIVVFATASTLTLTVRQRIAEVALLRSMGATPLQVGRMIIAEAALIAVVASVLAIPVAAVGGRLLLDVLVETGQASAGVVHVFGSVAVVMGVGSTFLAATIAALLTTRRIATMQPSDALATASIETTALGKVRTGFACLFLVGGISTGIVTATVFRDQGIDAMQTGGQASILFAIGLALFAPVLVRAVIAVLARPMEALGGVSGHLTVHNLRQRSHGMGSALMPIILFTGIAIGTLYMQSIENSTGHVPGSVTLAEAKNIETLNLVVVGMIAVFAAIMLINTLVAATTYRRREFAQQRLLGMTPRQVLGMVGLEGLVLASAGILFGSIAAVVTVIPYNIARTGEILPDVTITLYVSIAVVAAVLTLVSSLAAARRAVRVPAVDVLAARDR